MLGISMMLFGLLRPLFQKLHPMVGAAVMLVLFIFTYGVTSGYVGIPYFWEIPLPDFLYSTNYLFPLGFIPAGFYSADYFSLLPWLFLFFMGSFVGVYVKEGRFPAPFYQKAQPVSLLCGPQDSDCLCPASAGALRPDEPHRLAAAKRLIFNIQNAPEALASGAFFLFFN